MTIGAGRDFFAVCFYKSDKIKIIGCPDDSVKEAINTAIKVSPIHYTRTQTLWDYVKCCHVVRVTESRLITA